MTIHRPNRSLICILAVAAFAAALPLAQAGDSRQDEVREAASQSVKASKVFNAIMKSPDKGIPRDLLAHARAIAVFPGVVKAAFLVGGEGGRGVVSRRTRSGWSDPVFFSAGGGSVGWQVGASTTDIVLLFMNDEAVAGLMKDKFELGAEGAIAGGPVGRAASAGTDALMQAEILSYSRSRGLFAGLSLKGIVIRPEDDLNIAVYDKSARELLDLSKYDAANGGAADLQSFSKTVSRYTPNSDAGQ